MRIIVLDVDSMKMGRGSQIPEPGENAWEIGEGVKLYENKNTGKTSLIIPFVLDGYEASHFCPIMTQFGQMQLNMLLKITGLVEYFQKKFPDEFDPLDTKFEKALQAKLPGKKVRATHTLREYRGEQKVNFTEFMPVKTVSQQPQEDQEYDGF
jgi:hypothetical protein